MSKRHNPYFIGILSAIMKMNKTTTKTFGRNPYFIGILSAIQCKTPIYLQNGLVAILILLESFLQSNGTICTNTQRTVAILILLESFLQFNQRR